MDVQRAANVYHTDHALLFIVVIITLLVMMLVSATLYASCVLGRAVSMNSLEIAKTFNAPLLAIEDSNNDNKGLVKSLDAKPIDIVLSRSLRSMYQWLG
jgi:hypothetical protein